MTAKTRSHCAARSITWITWSLPGDDGRNGVSCTWCDSTLNTIQHCGIGRMTPSARILLIVSGGIAAYKSLELIRRGRDRGMSFRVILTRGGAEFVTPLSFSSISGEKVYQELF